ncbi:MAG: hypothetical protein EU550_00730 [Promethearchaeota archaeon]|nr:MAG: hypothetical protein EU550_00730 [Candidatus Lokiarchaeota archaeon]
MNTVLLLYGSRYGSTKEISERIADIFRQNNLDVELINLEETNLKDLPPLSEFDDILIGSGIKISKITKSVKKFLKKKADDLKGKNFGFFVSCLTANKPEDRPEARKKYIENVLKDYGINADMYEAFGGILDLSENSNLGGIMKKMMEKMAEEDPNIKLGELNDGRDWELITNFANKFCETIRK